MSVLRVIGGLVSMVLGGFVLSWLLLTMNAKSHRSDEVQALLAAEIKMERKKPKPKKVQRARPKPKPKRKPSRAPMPKLAMNMAGLGVGIEMFAANDLGGVAEGLLGDGGVAKDMVMTESSVDEQPRPMQRVPPKVPERVRSRGITGSVVARIFVGARGQAEKVEIVESTPPGVFDEAVRTAVQQWRFQPATYKGTPVSVWLTQRFDFKY